MTKTTGLWVAVAAIAGFCLLTVVLLGVIGLLWFTRSAGAPPSPTFAAAPPMVEGSPYTPSGPPLVPMSPAMATPSPVMPVMPPASPRSAALDRAIAAAGPTDTPPAPAGMAPPAPARMAAAGAPQGTPAVPAGYRLINATAVGQAFSTDKAKPTNVRDALEAGLDDLDDYFDTDYTITNTYEDQRDHRSGISMFEAQYKGAKVTGYVMARLNDKGPGASLMVLFANASATQAQWAQLTGTPPQNGAGPGPGQGQVAGQGAPTAASPGVGPGAGPGPQNAQATNNAGPAGNPTGQPVASAEQLAKLAAAVPLNTYRFPDNTGSVGLAEGWTTDAQSCQSMFVINGPNGAKVSFGLSLAVNTPNSTAVQMARQYGTGGLPLYVAAYGDPATVLNALVPQLSATQARAGGPTVTLDNLATQQKLPASPQAPNAQAAILTYGATLSQGGRQSHLLATTQVILTPMSNETFLLWMTEVAAPDASFQQQLPAMVAMVNSWKTNGAAMQANTDKWIADSNARFQAGQAAHKDLVNTYDRYNQAQADNAVTRARGVDDFVETIRGERTVQDTRTGTNTSVDLGNVDNVVNNLNQGDPGRYIQVPLRDQADPLPGGR